MRENAVRTGLEILLERESARLSKQRVALLAHPASVNRDLEHAVTLLYAHPNVRLSAIFGPQHGARGETQDNMIEWEDYTDPATGLPVYSLYGKTRKPLPEMLEEVDTVVIDLQDVGARYYTFIYSMALTMEACAEQGKSVLVLDRPNPIGGNRIEGPVLDPAFRSFVGLFPLPVRHGMTIGELAIYYQKRFQPDSDLEVIPMEGWRRESHFEETGLPWIPPSPNIPRIETTLVYPGMCLVEGTNLSEGRGTTLPFEFVGAPWIEPDQLVEELRSLKLPGVEFRPLFFQPTFHKWSEHLLGGVQIFVEDRESFLPFRTGVELIRLCRRASPEQFQWKNPPYEYEYELLPFDILCGTDRIRKAIEADPNFDYGELEKGWIEELEQFREERQRHLLY